MGGHEPARPLPFQGAPRRANGCCPWRRPSSGRALKGTCEQCEWGFFRWKFPRAVF